MTVNLSIILIFPSVILITMLTIDRIDGKESSNSSVNVNCTVKHKDRDLKEGEEITIDHRLYRVEECRLQRAYQTCGTHLWFVLNIVCQAIEQQKTKVNNRFRRFVRQKLLSEACCENPCTVAEMSRYCP